MATIIEDALFTLTDEAAMRMVESGLIVECKANHFGLNDVDKPFYHRAQCAPDWFGFATIPGAIISAERHVEQTSEEGAKT